VISDFDFSFKEELPTSDNNGLLPPISSTLRHKTSKFLVHVLAWALLTYCVSGFIMLKREN